MLKTIFSALSLVVLMALPGIANPVSVVISDGFKKAQKLEVSGESDHYLDLSESGYRVLKAYSSNHNQFRAVALSQQDNQQLVLKWLPGSTAKEASLVLKVVGPGGSKSLRFRVEKVKSTPENILTMYTQESTRPLVAARPRPLVRGDDSGPRHNVTLSGEVPPKESKTTLKSVKASEPLTRIPLTTVSPQRISSPAPKPIQLRRTPKPVQRVAKVSATGRVLIDRSTLDSKALANYLIRGLHRARGLRQINRNHKLYWQAQSAARYLKRGTSIEKALKYSHLPQKTFNDLLGHGGVSK